MALKFVQNVLDLHFQHIEATYGLTDTLIWNKSDLITIFVN